MNILTSQVPDWVSILFLLTIPIPIVMIANVAKQAAIASNFKRDKTNKIFWTVIAFYAIYFAYVSALSITGVIKGNSIPPKILLFSSVPFLVFLLLIVSNLKTFKILLEKASLQSLVGLHLFRLIGVFFFLTMAYGALPSKFAYLAGIGDITTAITSLWVAKVITEKKSYAKMLTIFWNIYGLCDILSVLVTAIILTRQAVLSGTEGVIAMADFPFCLIPAFAPPTIIFLHYTIFKKMWKERKEAYVLG